MQIEQQDLNWVEEHDPRAWKALQVARLGPAIWMTRTGWGAVFTGAALLGPFLALWYRAQLACNERASRYGLLVLSASLPILLGSCAVIAGRYRRLLALLKGEREALGNDARR